MHRLFLLIAVTFILALNVAACGGEEDRVAGPTATVAGAATPTPMPTATPGDRVIDGVTDIVLGSHANLLPEGLPHHVMAKRAYFDYVNEALGGVCGRAIVYKVEDDSYDPVRALEAVRKLVERHQVFAVVGGMGDITHSAVFEYLNEEGVPDLWVMSGVHKWAAHPEEYPWSVSLLPDYFVEGTIIGKYISQDLPGRNVGVLYQNGDFGRHGLAGLKNGLDPDRNEIVSAQSYDLAAADIGPQVAKMREDGAEVVVLYTGLDRIAQAVKEADRLGWHPQFLASYVNADPLMFRLLRPELAEGLISFGALKLADWTDDPGIAKHHEIMGRYSGPEPSRLSIWGQTVAALTVEVISRTCDNLKREGLMDAVESLKDYQSDLLLDGVTITLTDTDHLAIEAMRALRATVVDGEGKWEYFGPLFVFE